MAAYFTQGNLAVNLPKAKQSQTKTQTTVKKTKSISASEKLTYLFLILIGVTVCSLVLFRYSQLAAYNYQIQQTQNQIERITEENKQLYSEVAELSSAERIMDYASEKLGMTYDEKQVSILPTR